METLFINALGSREKYYALPKLNLGEKNGKTGYIDFITSTDMSHPIMQGYDSAGRKFVSIKVNTVDTENGDKGPVVGTFFERYSDNSLSLLSSKREWAFGTCYSLNIIHNDSRVRDYQYENLELRLKSLVDGKTLYDIDTSPTMDENEEVDYVLGNGKISFTL
jgi:hypothetical protein